MSDKRFSPSSPSPPRSAVWLLSRMLPHRDLVLAELEELYRMRMERQGRSSARRWYWSQVISFAWRVQHDRLVQLLRRLAHELTSGVMDLKYGVRRLVRRPGYLLASVLTLGIGVGGLATVYSVANWVLLRPIPGVSDPEGIALIRLESDDAGWPERFAWPISHPDLLALGEMMPSLENVAASTEEDVHILAPGHGRAERLPAEVVTGAYFDVLRTQPAAGRFFNSSDHIGGAGPDEVVVGYRLWQRLWRGDASAVGSDLRVNGRTYTVIGVAARGFRGEELPGRAELWFAESALPELRPEGRADLLSQRRRQVWRHVLGRMREGVTTDRVAAEANEAMERIRAEVSGEHSFLASHFVFRAYAGLGLSPYVRARVDRTLQILAGAGVLLLLLAMANVTNLALARLSSRRAELTVRRALGSGSWRIAREPLIESLIIGGVSSAIGLMVSLGGARLFGETSLSSRGGSLEGISLDWRVALAALCFALVASLLAGCVPSLIASRDRSSLRTQEVIGGYHSAPRLRAGMVVAQVALSAILVVGAALLARAALLLQSTDVGFESDRLLAFSIEPGLEPYGPGEQRNTLGRIHAALISEREFTSAGFIHPRPLSGWYLTSAFSAPGYEEDRRPVGAGFDVTPGLLTTLGVSFLAGRDFRPVHSRLESDSGSVIISESTARRAFPDSDPRQVVGRTLEIGYAAAPRAIVGVIADARLASVTGELVPLVFRPITDLSDFAELTVYARTASNEADAASIIAALGGLIRELPVYSIASARQQVAELLTEQRVLARLAVVLAFMGLFLAAVGLYGVLAYGVTERTREIGVRSALGAMPARILGGVFARGIALTLIGLSIGVPGAYWIVRLIQSRLYGVSAFDLPTYGLGLLAVLLVASLAILVPALRAVRISPVEALRST